MKYFPRQLAVIVNIWSEKNLHSDFISDQIYLWKGPELPRHATKMKFAKLSPRPSPVSPRNIFMFLLCVGV